MSLLTRKILTSGFGTAHEGGEKGSVLEANGTDFFKFTFSGNSEVSINMESKYGLTIVELTQKHIPHETDPTKNLYIQCQIGWTFTWPT